MKNNTGLLNIRYAQAMSQLDPINQDHVFNFYDKLDQRSKQKLLSQVEAIDWPEVHRLVRTHVKAKPQFTLPGNVQPAPWYPNKPDQTLSAKYRQATELGEQLLREGKVAAFTVAGGQGTRLNWDGPKGTYPATPIRNLPLFACLVEFIRNIQERFDTIVPWYIMTSPVNHEATIKFLVENNYFGLRKDNVVLFPQVMMPAFDKATGKVLLDATDSLALSPNGHGGSLKAIYTSGALDDMKQRGIEQISYVQIDNPIVRVIDPLFIGLHALDGAQMSSKMLPKAYPKEKLGNFCLVDGKMTVFEYSDLPDELACETLAGGELRFRAGSIAIHVMRVDFVEQLNKSSTGFALPFHRAEKKVEYIDLDSGQLIQPPQPNAVKLETFVFDALPLCNKSIVYETDRIDEFAPIKNTDGPPGSQVVDCLQTSKDIQIERAARWLESNGVKVDRDHTGKVQPAIEISQLTAIYPDDLKQLHLPDHIPAGTQILL